MGIKNEISQFYNRELVCIWSFPIDEGIDNELILDTGCVYFEIGDKYLRLCDIESEGKIEITIKDKIDYITDLDVTYKIDLRNFIINYPEAGYYVEKIGILIKKLIRKVLYVMQYKLIHILKIMESKIFLYIQE